MYIHKRENKAGVYYSFSYDDPKTGKRVRLKKGTYPTFTNEKDARAWANSQDAFIASRRELAQRRIAWKERFFDFTDFSDLYTEWQKKKAPNSWKRYVPTLELWVLPFFLSEKSAHNILDWPLLYQQFKDYLENHVTDGKLSYSSANKAIHTLNNFCQCLLEYNKIPEPIRKCPCFPNRLLNTKDYSSVVQPSEFAFIKAKLQEIDATLAQMWHLLYHTGMRLNEARSLPLGCLQRGAISGLLGEALKKHNIRYEGYLVLESQLKEKGIKRQAGGKLERKPLKSKPRIHPKYNRTIPIQDRDTFNILARRQRAQARKWENREYGQDKNNYILFEDFVVPTALRKLHQIYKTTGYKPKTWHDLRHTFCTMFAGKVIGDTVTPKAILGHTSKTIERYMHIFEQMAYEAQRDDLVLDEID